MPHTSHKSHPLIFLAFALILAQLFACERDQQEQHPPLIRPVRFEKVFLTGTKQVRTFSGTAQGGLEAKLSFRVSGTVKHLYVKVGDKLKKAQIVASLDPRDYELQVERADAALLRAKANARKTAADYSRIQDLYENRNASRSDLDQARAAAESSRAEVSSNSKDLELARLQLEYTRLTSPTDCSVATVPVEVNENVQAGVTTVAEVICGTRHEVEVNLPGALIAGVKKGSNVDVTFDAIPGLQFPATVTKVGVAAGQTATTFPVTVQLQQDIAGFRSGLAAEVTFRFESDSSRALFLVPPVAVGEDRGGRYVYRIEQVEPGFGIVRRKPVKVGDLTGEGLEILDGLADGDLIVTAGVRRLFDGRKVRLMEPPEPSP